MSSVAPEPPHRAPRRANLRASPATGVGPLLRGWRQRRRRSQLDLALDVGVSARHLSFVETGRARPSPGMLMALAEHLEVPLRERNQLLLAAGYAPRYSTRLLDEPAMQQVRAALQRLLLAHEPNPGLVLDRHWNVVLANRPAQALTALLPAQLCQPTLNIFRASLHPQGLAAHTANFADWAGSLLRNLQRAVAHSHDPGLAALAAEVQAYPNVQALLAQADGRPATAADAAQGAGLGPAATQPPPDPLAPEHWPGTDLLLPCVLNLPQGPLSMFTTLTTFGSPRDVLLDELCIELFYPADAATEQRLRAMAAQADDPLARALADHAAAVCGTGQPRPPGGTA